MGLKKLVSDIIVELTRLQSAAVPPWKEDDDFPLPRMIAVDGERTLFVSKKIDDLIDLLSLRLHSSDSELGKRVGSGELRSIVRRAFGPALAAIDLDHDVSANAKTVFSNVRSFVEQSINRERLRFEHCFGCTLFSRILVSDFAIGAVRFEARMGWLERKRIESEISLTTYRRVKKIWTGSKLRARKGSSIV